ncbi:MAG: adenylate/guanylate cyclase domain-containing protein [Saprospiraceae bacterium]
MKAILHVFFATLALLLPLIGWTQSAEIQDLETKLRSVAGVERIETFVALSEAYLATGDHDKALKHAEDGTDLAQRMRRNNYLAITLNQEGKILAITGKRGLFGKDRAAAKFRESNQVLKKMNRPNKQLFLDNLESLRALAEKYNRKDELAEIEMEIDRAKNLIEALPSNPSIALEKPLTRQELQEELSVITDQLLDQQKSQESSTLQRLNYEKERQQLQAELKQQEAFIDQMTENQMKAALLLMQHRTKLDSLEYRSNLDALNVTNAELALRESESKRNFYLAAMVAMIMLAGGAAFSYYRARQNAHILREKNKIIRSEQKRSEELLLNILPALVAEELKKNGSTSARYFDDVGVLFADFVGFSKIAEILSPQELVNELDTCFRAFDDIIAKHKLEKIKTIGDAYMAAGGLLNGGGSQLRDMVNAAQEMQAWLAEWNQERSNRNLPVFEARIGIHSGPVVAGVVGSKKFAFDIWGDTVNIAARIESAGEGGKINISGEVHNVIKQYFPCQYRGKIPAKNKGEIDMYFVEN